MFVIRCVIPDVGNFLVDVPFHAPASRRVELGQVADFQGSFVIPSEVEESLNCALRIFDFAQQDNRNATTVPDAIKNAILIR